MLVKLLLATISCALLCATTLAEAAETDRWQVLFSAVPQLPATTAEVIPKIGGRRVNGQLRMEIADAGLKALQRDVDNLYDTTAKGSRAQMQSRLDEVNKDPELAGLAHKIDDVIGLEKPTGKTPTSKELKKLNKEADRVLGPGATSRDVPPAMTEIASYRLELQRKQPRPAQFIKRLYEVQRRYARQHAQADRDAMARLAGADATALKRDLVDRHHVLARRQLADATAIFSEARNTITPSFERMAQLARAAELGNASPSERIQAYALFKAYVEMLLTLQRETLQDVGFWAGIRPRSGVHATTTGSDRTLYENSLAPDVELHGNGTLMTSGPHYPSGRAIVFGLPPGIR